MYTRINLVNEIENPEAVTCIESYEQSIYLGTVNGEIVHYFRNGDEFIFASKQKSKKKGVKGIWLLPEIQRALVLSGSTTSVFSLPEFAPCSMKSMRDVNDISCQSERGKNGEITVFSSTAIRIVSIENEGLKLIRNIDYPGVLKGVHRDSYALVASETYDLIDLDNVQKIPLFPVNSNVDSEDKLEPFIVPINHEEFLVTSGTSKEDPAMGLVVNVNGDISRGTIAWPSYPSSLAVDFPNVAAVIGDKVLIYSLIDQSLVQSFDFSSEEEEENVVEMSEPHSEQAAAAAAAAAAAPKEEGEDDGNSNNAAQSKSNETNNNEKEIKVMNVLEAYETRNNEAEEKLKKICIGGEEGEEKVAEYKTSSSMFLFSTKVECLLSSPRIIELEKIEKDDELFEEFERFDLTSEQSIIEMEYLKMMIGLRSLKRDQVSSIWLDGTLDPRTIVYIFSKQDVQGKLWLFNGLLELTNSIPTKKRDKFLKQFYKEWMKKRNLESIADKHDVFHSLEIAYLRLLVKTNSRKEEIHAFIDNEVVESADNASELLKEYKKWFSLSRLYQKQGKIELVLQVWKKMLTKEWKDDEFQHGEEKMAAYLKQCKNDDLVWEYGMWLLQRYTPVIEVFKNDRFDDQRVIEELKKLENNDDDGPRREYLKYLVYDKKSSLFTRDLISFLVDDLLEKMDRKFVQKTYEDYRGLIKDQDVDKRSYIEFLTDMQQKKLNNKQKEEVQLRLEVLYLLQSSDYDAEEIATRIQDTPLTMELCITRGKLCLHEVVLATLCHDLHDYKTVISYCKEYQLFPRLFMEFLKLEPYKDRLQCVRWLLDKWNHQLDINLVLENIPNEWPVEILNEYLSQVFKNLLTRKNKSLMEKNLARAEYQYLNSQLRGFKSLIDE